jgi:hypothetical protein
VHGLWYAPESAEAMGNGARANIGARLMHNVSHRVDGEKLIITVDISKKAIDAAPPSSSGKTFLVGSTSGTIPVETRHCRELSFSVNIMAKK